MARCEQAQQVQDLPRPQDEPAHGQLAAELALEHEPQGVVARPEPEAASSALTSTRAVSPPGEGRLASFA